MADFFGQVKTGLQYIASDRYGYSLFVPSDYSPEQSWPLVIALHDEGGKGEEYIQTWLEEAKKRGLILLCPTYPVPRDNPFDNDKRILKLKRLVEHQYLINPKRILIVGFGFGGHYAFYLGFRYPSEFSSVASIGDGLIGRFTKMFRTSYAEVHRLPFLMLVPTNAELQTSEYLEELEAMRKRGYRIEVSRADGWEANKSFIGNSYILGWFDQAARDRERQNEQRSPKVKEKVLEWLDQLFQNL